MKMASGKRPGTLTRVGKRTLDLVGAGIGLVLSALPMLIIAVWVRLSMGPPVLFPQDRPGLHGRPFRMLKFRTMATATDPSRNTEDDAQRLTKLGRFLRRTSLDELPELLNVLRGEMSLVGPRPLLMEYLPLYTSEQARRHDVKPGITGWAQINGRNALDWEERFRLDVWYVDNQSLSLDLYILFRTGWEVITGRGVSSPGHVTMSKFTGTSR
jgi:lipopolysaccharide/colanic/teichoic acid biosynthesis glycosyltransferase